MLQSNTKKRAACPLFSALCIFRRGRGSVRCCGSLGSVRCCERRRALEKRTAETGSKVHTKGRSESFLERRRSPSDIAAKPSFAVRAQTRLHDCETRTNRMRRTAIPRAAADSLRYVFLPANRNTHCGPVLNARKQYFGHGVRLGAPSLWKYSTAHIQVCLKHHKLPQSYTNVTKYSSFFVQYIQHQL